MSRRTAVAALVALAVSSAACDNGNSILQAGNDIETVTTLQPATTVLGATTVVGETTVVGATTVVGETTTVVTAPAPTTVQQLLDTLPQCPLEALESASAGGPVEITFWHGLSNENGRALEELTAAYNASQSRVRVNLEFQGSYEQTIDKYLQSNTDNRPDLVQMPEYTVQLMIDTGSTVPVQACTEAAGYALDRFLPRTLAAYSTEGVQWAMPFNVSNPVLFYNKKLFVDAGLDPELPPLTLEDVDRVSTQLRESGAAGAGMSLNSSIDGGGGWFIEQWFAKAGQLYADNGNGRLAPATKVLYDSPTGVELLTFMQQQVQSGNAVYVGDDQSGTDTLLKLADPEQPAAMAVATSAALGAVLTFVNGGLIPGITAADIGVGPMPGPGGAPGVLVGGNALWIVAGKGDARAAAAWDYVSYVVSAQSQSTFAAATGYVPIRFDALDLDPIKSLYTTDPRFKVAFDQLVASADDPSAAGPVLGPLREVRTVTASAVAQVLQGADVQTALSEAAAQANGLIADYLARTS